MSDGEPRDRVLCTWGGYDWDDPLKSTERAGARMSCTKTSVIVEVIHYDHEDNREYYNCGIFSREAYIKAFQEMETTGHSKVEGNGDDLALKKTGEFVELKLHGTPSPGSSPGGTQIFSTCDLGKISLEKLRLQN